MKTLSLISCRGRNFKGFVNQEFNLGGKSTAIYGKNKAGKTTLVDMITWLFRGKDSQDRKDFSIRPVGVAGTCKKDAVESEVEGSFLREDGTTVTLKRVFKERWTKKRGELIENRDGNTTKYFVDSVSVPQRTFNERVVELTGDEKNFQILTIPLFFNEKLKWEERRQLIVAVCGDVTDEAVIASKSALTKLTEYLGGMSVDDRKATVKAEMTEINDDMRDIPGRIDEVTRAMPEVSGNGAPAAISKLDLLQAELNKANERVATIKSGGGAMAIKADIKVVNQTIIDITRDTKEKNEKAEANRKAQMENITIKRSGLVNSKSDLDKRLGLQRSASSAAREMNEVLFQEHAQVLASTFSEKVCEHCGQELAGDALQKAMESFNDEKATMAANLVTRGLANMEKLEDIDKSIAELGQLIRDNEADIAKLDEEEKAILATILVPDDSKQEEYHAAVARMDELVDKLSSLETSNAGAIEGATAVRDKIAEEIAEHNAIISKVQVYQENETRIAELKQQKKDLATRYEELQQVIYLIETFTRAKVAMMESVIAEKFSFVGFEMFFEQQNGGLREKCEATVDGVPYHDLNNAAKVQAGIDIINTFSKHFDFQPFIFIDNRESVTDIPSTDAQVISLYVSPDAETLLVTEAA